VRGTRDALEAQGFEPQMNEINGHTHWYYDRAPEINKQAWAFLRQHALADEPKYERHSFSR